MGDLIQHAIVTIVALGCAGLTAARLFGGFRRGAVPARGCTGCPSSKRGGPCSVRLQPDPDAPKPMTFIRRRSA